MQLIWEVTDKRISSKRYTSAYAPNEDSDQPAYLRYPVDTQTDFNLRCTHTPICTFSYITEYWPQEETIQEYSSMKKARASRAGETGLENKMHDLDWLQSSKQFFINVSYQKLVASLTLMGMLATRVKQATSLWYGILMKICFKDRSKSMHDLISKSASSLFLSYCAASRSRRISWFDARQSLQPRN